MKTHRLFSVIFSFSVLLSAGTVLGQITQVELQVDGLACPFCAYGLEKKLKAVNGVQGVSISVDKGLVILKSKNQESIAVEQIDPAVQSAGFTPRSILLTAVGQIALANSTWVLQVSDSTTKFILKRDPAISLKETTKPVKVTGRLSRGAPAGHRAHPYILTIKTLEDK